MQVHHCNVCGAVLAVGPVDADDPMVLQHRDWHKAMFAAVDCALGRVNVAPEVVVGEGAHAVREAGS